MDNNLFEERKKMIYELICDELYVPMKAKEIAALINAPKSDRAMLQDILNELVSEGSVEISSKGKYFKSEKVFVLGTFEVSRKGYGFVIVDGEDEDIFIPADCVNNAMHGDIVRVSVNSTKTGKRREGVIEKIEKRNVVSVVGTFQKSKTFGFVVPDNNKINRDIFVPSERSKGAKDGQKVVVKLTDYGNEKRKPEGIVTEILGFVDEKGVDILSIIRDHDLPTEFPERCINQANKVPDEVSLADMQGRIDLREQTTVTIDGEDAKDLDDAITLSKIGNLYELGVHIADVSNYVQEHSALDVEALKRGTSVYMVDRVIPMLPKRLSNGICSLNAGCDRLTLSCIMKIDDKGKVIDYNIAETVINVNERMSYTSVNKILTYRDEEEIKRYNDLVPMFELMEELAGILHSKRRQRGSIDFDFPETKIILDENGKPVEVKPYERNVATNIIEEFMLIANETIAQDYFWQELPFVYRTHDTPDADKIRKLSTFINNFGYTIKSGNEDIHPKELQKLLTKIADTDKEMLISRVTLRSMKQAKYSTECTGHFGLATNYYCHFTSPIRRYPDLQIHRIIKDNIRGRLNDSKIAHYNKILNEVAQVSSKAERRADEAERDSDKQKKTEFMSDKIGEEFDGVISGMNVWGIYVELENTIEGMVRVSDLPGDFYEYCEETYEMVGEHTNKRYKLGQKVRIRVIDTDILRRTIDFELVEQE